MKMRVLGLMVMAAVVSVSAFAAINRFGFPVLIPGVAADGSPDFVNTGTADVKGFVNTRNNRFAGTVRGQTPNASNRLQVYRNNPNINAFLPPGINHSLVLVLRNGRVLGSFAGKQ